MAAAVHFDDRDRVAALALLEQDALSTRRPDRKLGVFLVEGQPRHCLAFDVVDPDFVRSSLVTRRDGDPALVRRQSGVGDVRLRLPNSL